MDQQLDTRKNLSISMFFTAAELSFRNMPSVMEIEAIDTSMKWQMVVEDVFCTSVSSVRMEDVNDESEDHDPQTGSCRSLRTLKLHADHVKRDSP